MLACFQLEMRKTLSIHYRADQLPGFFHRSENKV